MKGADYRIDEVVGRDVVEKRRRRCPPRGDEVRRILKTHRVAYDQQPMLSGLDRSRVRARLWPRRALAEAPAEEGIVGEPEMRAGAGSAKRPGDAANSAERRTRPVVDWPGTKLTLFPRVRWSLTGANPSPYANTNVCASFRHVLGRAAPAFW